MDAARSVMADKGADATTLRDIADAAGLGLGTLYNHFDGKDGVVEAIVDDAVESLRHTLDELTASLADPAEIFSVAFRQTLRMVEADPIWGWFVVRVPAARERVAAHLGERSTRNISRGLRSGRFQLPGRRSFYIACEGLLLAGMQAKLDDRTRRGDDERFAELGLRMLGLEHDEARRTSQIPLPALGSRGTPDTP